MTENVAGNKMKLKGKPKCPLCGKPLIFVYEGSTGYSGVKCKRCNQTKEEKKSSTSSVWDHPLLGAGCNKCNGQVYMFEKKNGKDLYCRNCGRISWNSIHQY